jgi:hypothetical protein
MKYIPSNELCNELGLSIGQHRDLAIFRNLWWSFDHDRWAFGFGDLDDKDIKKIYAYLCDHQTMIFTGWDNKHGTEEQITNKPMMRISYGAGMTQPFHHGLELAWR